MTLSNFLIYLLILHNYIMILFLSGRISARFYHLDCMFTPPMHVFEWHCCNGHMQGTSSEGHSDLIYVDVRNNLYS